jgi:hypothetical protein
MTAALFQGIKMPDGANFEVLTEDEGDPEMLYTAQLAAAGLSIIVQSPTGKFSMLDGSILQINPLVVAVSISEAILFNRADQGTKIRLMHAVHAVLKVLTNFAPPSIQTQLLPTRMLKDRDTQPGTDDLVVARVLVFEATEVPLTLS